MPVRVLSAAFLFVLGLAVAATAQITGVLLVFALLLAPAAIARELTPRIGLGLALSVLLGLVIAWVGLGLSYFTNDPAGFFVTTHRAGAVRAAARLARSLLMGFLGNALLAGSCIAVASGLIGYFVVLRVQVFAGDALCHVAFTGALAAAAAGLDLRVGLFAATVAVALALGLVGGPRARRSRARGPTT